MKLVIDLPEWFIEDTKEFNHPTPMDKAIINGQPLDEILDKISAEIEELEKYTWFIPPCPYVVEKKKVLEIVEKYKAESEGVND